MAVPRCCSERSSPGRRQREEWPQFRGPSGLGYSAESGLPVEWSETRNIVWKVAVGAGWSSPVVAGDRVRLTTAVEARDGRGHDAVSLRLVRFDLATGHETLGRRPALLRQRWRRLVDCRRTSGRLLWQQRLVGNYSASPVLADGHVYVLSEEGVTTVFSPGPEFHKLALNQLDGMALASMAVSHGSTCIRTDTHLCRIAANASTNGI